jgi:DNA-binding NarL/FixJ family response regulator
MDTVRVFIADDEVHARSHLAELLLTYPDMAVCGQAISGIQAYEMLKLGNYELAFIDIDMPGMTGLETVRSLAQANFAIPYIIFVTAFGNHGVTAFDLGAIDYIVKPVSALRLSQAIDRFRRFTAGSDEKKQNLAELLALRYGLTAREIEICLLIKQGKIREEIRSMLDLSDGTLKTHLGHIYEKTELLSDDSGRSDKFSRLLFLLFSVL